MCMYYAEGVARCNNGGGGQCVRAKWNKLRQTVTYV